MDFIKSYTINHQNLEINNNILVLNKKYYIQIIFGDNYFELKNPENNLINNHFFGIINKKYQIQELPDFLDNIINLVDTNYCIVCHKLLESQSESYIPCSNQICRYKFEEIIIGNPVIEFINRDREISGFLFESARDAILSDRKFDIFEPFPSYFTKNKTIINRDNLSKLSGKNLDFEKDFDKLSDIINSINPDQIFDLIQNNSIKSDLELSNIIGQDSYILIRFILLSCKLNIEKLPDLFGYQNINLNIYQINYPLDKIQKFNKSRYLFHGSKWQNWYSILRNGLKNCSGTHLMTAGAAYGPGVYLSDNINLSYGYGLVCHKSYSAVGVFEVAQSEKFHKSQNIFVVTDEKSLIQKYLLLIKSNKILPDLNSIFNQSIYQDEKKLNIKLNTKSVSKIMREYNKIIKNPNLPFRLEFNPDQISNWKIFITSSKFDPAEPIYQDLIKFQIPEIELEIIFPESYPFDPPFIRIIKPRFARMTAHITSGGSICAELLTPKGWSPIFTIESIIIQIISFIVEGKGRLDPENYNIPYSYSESKESFLRVAGSHGWL